MAVSDLEDRGCWFRGAAGENAVEDEDERLPGETEGLPESGDIIPEPPVPVGGADDLGIVGLYLRDTRRCGRLTGKDEQRCARSMRRNARGNRKAEQSAAEAAAFHASRHRMIEGSLGLVVAIAREYEHLGLPLEDLIQEGNLGLIAAVDKFDPERNLRLSTYAVTWIREAICRALSQKSRTIRIPLDKLAIRRRAAKVHDEIEQRYGNEACCGGSRRAHTLEDDAGELGVDAEVLRTTIRLVPDIDPLEDRPSGRPSLLASLPDPQSPNPADRAAAAEQQQRVRDAVSELPPRLQWIVRRRYGLSGGEEAGLAKVGREVRLSAERVRQLQRRALRLLRGIHASSAARTEPI